MSLTPEDIEKKRFHDAWRGYNHEEVDLFLDEVAATVVALRRQLAAGGGGGGVSADSERVLELEAQAETLRRQLAQSAQGGAGASDRLHELESQAETLRRNLAESERNLEQARRSLDEVTLELQAAQAAAAARASATAGEAREARADELRGTESLLRRTLIAAQKAADEAVAEAEQQAAESLAEARRVAAQIEADASDKGNALLVAAQQQIDELEVRTQQLRALYAEHHERARVFVEEQRQALDRMPAPEEVGTLTPRHGIPGEVEPAAGPPGGGYAADHAEAYPASPEGEAAPPAEATAGTQDYEVVPLVRSDEGLDDSTRIHEANEPAWPVSGPEATDQPGQGESPWSRPEGEPGPAPGQSPGAEGSPPGATEETEPSVRELFWGKS